MRRRTPLEQRLDQMPVRMDQRELTVVVLERARKGIGVAHGFEQVGSK